MSAAGCNRLRVLSWAGGWGRALRAAVSDPFERATGIQVEHVPHVGLKLPKFLLTALAQGEPPPLDVIWCNSVPAMHAQQLGYCATLDLACMPVLRELRARARPEGLANYSVVHPYVVYYVLAYHEHACPHGAPTSWNELLEARHAGKIALYPGGNGFYPIAQIMGGGTLADIPDAMDACWSYLRRLRPYVGELDYSIGMEERLRNRSLNLCFRALTNALAFRAAGIPVAWCVPHQGTTDTVDALWIPRGLPDAVREVAQSYLAFALSRNVQTQWCSELGAMPVHPEARIPAIFNDRNLPAHADDHRGILHVAEPLKVQHELQWESRFHAIFAPAAAALGVLANS